MSNQLDSETRRALLIELGKCCVNGDIEAAHYNADEVLCVALKRLGYGDIVAAWEKVDKWYA